MFRFFAATSVFHQQLGIIATAVFPVKGFSNEFSKLVGLGARYSCTIAYINGQIGGYML
jgi:hypothetical protein